MKESEKQLLLKDLCARLPYGVIINRQGYIQNLTVTALQDIIYGGHKVTPYLRPMSSMTEEERDELYTAMDWYGEIDENGNVYTKGQEKVYRETFYEYTDWLLEHHFDFRGLIPMGLALEAPEDMYKTK